MCHTLVWTLVCSVRNQQQFCPHSDYYNVARGTDNTVKLYQYMGFPGGSDGKESTYTYV